MWRHGGVIEPGMSENFKRENREIPTVSNSSELERSANASGGTADMYADGKSDGSVVPTNPANNSGTEPPAGVGRGKGPSQEERRTSRPAPNSESGKAQVPRIERRA